MEKIEKDKFIRSQKSKVKARGRQKSSTRKSKSNPTKPKQKKRRKYKFKGPKIGARSHPPTSAVRNTVRKGNEQILKNPNKIASDAALRDYYDKHYHRLLPIIAEKVHQEMVQQEKLKEVKARLNFEECSRRNSRVQEVSQNSESRTPTVRREHRRERRFRRSRKVSESPKRTSVFFGIRRDRSESRGTGQKGKVEEIEGVWFDDLPLESIDSYDNLKKAFLANYLQQKKCLKNPVEIHHIKQREGESTEYFVERFKAESRHVKGAPKCMIISGFMHGITNPKLIKRLHEKISKSVDEILRVTIVFLRGEVAASNHVRKNTLPAWKQQESGRKQNFDRRGDFRINRDQSENVTNSHSS
nr:reverse transcriptase domain-containing protein [Tanacetum cinerariifolium]